jgi:hypothetical protein
MKSTPAQIRAYRNYYNRHKDEIKARRKLQPCNQRRIVRCHEYYDEHKVEIAKAKKNSKNRLHSRVICGTSSLELTGKCSMCGRVGFTCAHHIIPRWFSHDDSKDNLLEVCPSCHGKCEIFINRFLGGDVSANPPFVSIG